MGERPAEAGTCERAASAGPRKIQACEWVDGAVQRKAGAAISRGRPRFARGKRAESAGSPGTSEHDGADAAAGNDDAFRVANCGSGCGFGCDIEFGRGDRHDGNFDALTVPEFPGCAGIAGGRSAASDLSTGGD